MLKNLKLKIGLLFLLALALFPAAASNVCGIAQGTYTAKFISDVDDAQGTTSQLALSVGPTETTISFGNVQTVVGLVSENLRCTKNGLRFDFDDGWGNKGYADLARDKAAVIVRLFISSTDDTPDYRNVTALYPPKTLRVLRR